MGIVISNKDYHSNKTSTIVMIMTSLVTRWIVTGASQQ